MPFSEVSDDPEISSWDTGFPLVMKHGNLENPYFLK